MKDQELSNTENAEKKEIPGYLKFAVELQRLAAESQQGDKTSYKKFLQMLQPQVRKYVQKKWWGDDNSVEDLVQDVMIAVHTSLHTHDPDRPILPWIKTFVTYKIADYARKFSRWDQNEISEEKIDAFEGPSTNNESQMYEDADYIDKAIESLPEKYALIVRLLRQYGHSHQEVASKLGMSVAAVKTYSYRAQKKMIEFRDKTNRH